MGVPLSGCALQLYTAPLRMGEQTFDVVMDTGSSQLFLEGDPCIGCDAAADAVYQSGESAKDLGLTNNPEYGAGGVFGKVYLDQVSVPNVTEPITFAFTRASLRGLWPMTSCVDPGITVPVQGLLGLNTDVSGPLTQYKLGRLGEDRFLPAHIKAGMPAVLATQLCDSGGYLWLGGYNPSHTTSATFVTMFHRLPDMFNYLVEVKACFWATRACTTATPPGR